MRDLMLQFSNNIFIEILMLAICADTLLGALRAIKFRQFNSSVGIDGAIRKVAMVCGCPDAGGFTDSCESSGFYT